MACTKETVKSSGLNTWSCENADGPTPIVDIIIVQGLGAHPFYTWAKKIPLQNTKDPKRPKDKGQLEEGKELRGEDGEGSTAEVMWPRDTLVPLFQDARIATYSYRSDWRDRTIKTSLRQCAEQFLNILFQYRQQSDEQKRPLVLIGHSLGCLVIQQALVIAIHQQAFTNLRLSVAGIIFLGAPFQGSDTALFGTWLAKALRRDTTLLELLKKDSQALYDLSRDFWGSYSAWDLVCFYEMIDAEFGPIKTQVVSSQSATLLGKRMIFLNTDHSGLNKFSGEGDENFALLLPEIQRMIRDGLSIVVDRHRVKDADPANHGNVHWMVPRTINSLFTGRDELLRRIQKAIHCDSTSGPDKQKRFVITGLGGQGKSEICLQIANQMREEFWGVFWVDVGMASTAESKFIAIAKLLGRSVENVSDALQVLATIKQSWLLILDNADDPNFDYQAYFPSGTHGAILMTSRIPECKGYSPEQFEALEGLGNEDAKELLLKASKIPKPLWLSHDDQAEIVVQLLGSHTLALIQAGAYIAQGHCQLHQYPKVYQRQRKRLLQFRPKQAQSRYHDVYATFEASAEVLEQSESEATEDALHLLAVLSMLDSAILPCQIFEEAWNNSKLISTESEESNEIDDLSRNHILRLPSFLVAESDEWDSFRFTEASSQLISLSLIIQHNTNGLLGLSMHPLAHAWAKDRQDPKQQGIAWIAAGCILTLSRQNSTLWQTQKRQLLPHIRSCLNIKVEIIFSFEDQSIVVPILLRCGWILLDMRQDTRLSHLLEDVFIGINKNPEEPSKESLPLYDLQARSLLNTGKNKKAVSLLEQVVKIRETIQAEDHPSRLASQHVLAMAYEANGQIKEAVALLEQVVKIRETILAEDHPDRLASQHVLACAYQANGQIKEAVALLEQVVKIRETILAEDHPSRLTSQHELAIAYEANGQIKEAVALLEQVVKIREITLAEDHPDRLASQHVLAHAYQANRQIKEAVALLEQVVKIRETIQAEDHPSRLASQHVLAGAYQANGQIKEAVALLEQVVKIQEITLAKDHPSRLTSQHELARVYQANGQIKEAVALLEQVVKIREAILAEDHPSRLTSQHELARAYQANRQIKEAVALLEQVVKIREITLAEDHPSRLSSQHVLACAYQANGQIKEAVALLEQVVKIQEITLTEDHPDRLTSQHTLAGAYQANGQVKEAVALLEQVVKIREITLAEDHPDRLTSQHTLAGAYRANGQIKEAVALLEQVVKIQEIIQAEDHPHRLALQHALAMAYQANGQVKEAVALLEQVVKIKRVKFQMEHRSRIASEKWLSYLLEQT
ncbi:hypothetical protein ACHAO8_007970 [Botrytis cinerea]